MKIFLLILAAILSTGLAMWASHNKTNRTIEFAESITTYARHLGYARGVHDCQYPSCNLPVHFTKSGTGTSDFWWKEYVCGNKHVIVLERK